jgi:3-oxoacyl-[acyl-carrier protein] reductase
VTVVGFDLTGRRALITGAGRGIGAGIAAGLAAAGVSVVVNDLVAERAETCAAELRQNGADASAAAFDVTDYEVVREAVASLGDIDVLVNNAGNAGSDRWPGMTDFAETEPRDWEMFLRVNLYGVMHCVRAVLPGMVTRNWGRLITIISDSARVGQPKLAVYGAAKAGAAGLMRGVAAEVGRHGITANCVSLGMMRTPLSEAGWATADEDQVDARLRGYAVRRPGVPDDVVGLVVYLASNAAEWLTGQTIALNGGYSNAL